MRAHTEQPEETVVKCVQAVQQRQPNGLNGPTPCRAKFLGNNTETIGRTWDKKTKEIYPHKEDSLPVPPWGRLEAAPGRIPKGIQPAPHPVINNREWKKLAQEELAAACEKTHSYYHCEECSYDVCPACFDELKAQPPRIDVAPSS